MAVDKNKNEDLSQLSAKELKEMAEKIGIADKIVWCGYKSGSDLEAEYGHAQAFVLPTKDDCFGLVLLEAMCAGVPILASKYADGAYDIVINGENGFIADPFSPAEFVQAINQILSLWDTLCSEKAHIDKFAFENVCAAYIEAVNYVL